MSGVVKIHIAETEEVLKTLLLKVESPQNKERIQTLYWLKTKRVTTVLEIATLLGRHRTTVQRWLSNYRQGGLERLLEERKSPGRPKLMTPGIIERLLVELQEAEGFHSYQEVQRWLLSCCDLQVSYRTVHQWVRYRLQGKLKVPRPVSIKQKQGVVEELKKNCLN
jgi:putative transposase